MFPDIREEHSDEDVALFLALINTWPGVPGLDIDARYSGIHCAVMVQRANWVAIPASEWPRPSAGDDSLTRLVFAKLDLNDPGYENGLKAMYKEILSDLGKSVDDASFARVCRGQMMRDNLWNLASGRYQLTRPRFLQGPDISGVKLICSGDELAKEGFLTWDGISPPTAKALIDDMTREITKPGNTASEFVIFNTPTLMQVDLVPGPDSTRSLADIWRFEAWSYELRAVEGGEGSILAERPPQPYTIVAIVRHRQSPEGYDSMRFFRRDGQELLPDQAINRDFPSWGFKLSDVVPPGERLSIFYQAVRDVEHSAPRERRRLPRIPETVQKSILDWMDMFKE